MTMDRVPLPFRNNLIKSGATEDEGFHIYDLAFGGLMQKALPKGIKKSLLDKGFIEMKRGGEVLTDNGYRALVGHRVDRKSKREKAEIEAAQNK